MSNNLFSVFTSVNERNVVNGVKDVALAIEQYRKVVGAYPDSLDDLHDLKGFNGQRFRDNAIPRLYYSKASINDGEVIFDRYIVGTVESLSDSTLTQFLTTNNCGTNTFSQVGSFCPDSDSTFYIGSNKLELLGDRAGAVKRVDDVLYAFLSATDGTFSDLGGAVTSGSTVNIPVALGYTGTADACSGSFTVDDVVFTCSTLFNSWGFPFLYSYVSESRIAVQSVLPYQAASGENIRIIREAIL